MLVRISLFRGLKKNLKTCIRRSFSIDKPLVSVDQLSRELEDPAWHTRFRVLDAQWDLDAEDYHSRHMQQRISGAKFFSFDECRDTSSTYNRMLPSAQVFCGYVSALGIGNEHHVIVYDNNPRFAVYSAPRVWWMFRAFGHPRVSVLDGGLRGWLDQGNPCVEGPYTEHEQLPKVKKQFKGGLDASLVKSFEWVQENCQSDTPTQLIDARRRDRFVGLNADRTPDPKNGHITNSFSTPFTGFVGKDWVQSKQAINEYFQNNKVDLDKEMVATCGSGITACILALALQHSAGKRVSVYDGSWGEYKARANENQIQRGEP